MMGFLFSTPQEACENVCNAIKKGDPAAINKSLKKLRRHMNSIDHNAKRSFLIEALSLTHQRTQCVSALQDLNYSGFELISALAGATEHSESRAPSRLDPSTVEALWELGTKQPDPIKQTREKDKFILKLMQYQPAKSLMDAMLPQSQLLHDNTIGCFSSINQYCTTDENRPDAERLASDTEYHTLHEDIRHGILKTYGQIRPEIMKTREDLVNVGDHRTIIPFTAFGLEQRFKQYAAAPRSAETQHIRDELRLYQQTGLLGDLFTLAGPATGFATDLEYKTALREQIIPLLSTPAERAQVLGAACWAEYVRTKPIDREGSAIATYLKP